MLGDLQQQSGRIKNGPHMPIYAVIAKGEEAAAQVQQRIQEGDRVQISPEAWFVYSDRYSAGDVAKALGFADDDTGRISGVAITATYYSGFADSSVIELWIRRRDASWYSLQAVQCRFRPLS